MSLRVGTWNVQFARGVDKNTSRLRALTIRRADVWLLTETHDDLDLSDTHTPVHSEHRYAKPGGRWTGLWTSLPILERLKTSDPSRCVAVRLDGGAAGELLVYGTVLPWQHDSDQGPNPQRPVKGWAEFARVITEQGQEWLSLRNRHPEATLVLRTGAPPRSDLPSGPQKVRKTSA